MSSSGTGTAPHTFSEYQVEGEPRLILEQNDVNCVYELSFDDI